jgi:aspartate/methionine/tyrosine aminotransferase
MAQRSPGVRNFVSKKAAQFSESVIREMTRLAQTHQAVNLAQGFPDFPAPGALKEPAKRAGIRKPKPPGAPGREWQLDHAAP